jgi:hypothetical protein
MIPEIAAAWSATIALSKAIAGALKTAKDIETKQAISDIQDSLLDVQAKLATAQSQYEALSEVKQQLEQKVMEYEKWDSEAARYKLTEIAPGIFVYALKPDHTASEPSHWLCPNCFHQRQKSILSKSAVDYINYKCHRCQFEITPTPFNYPKGDDFAAETYDHF